MMTVKQVSGLTGVSVRTLQFYDEIGLFRPTEVTGAGYRLYDESALETLQQILFFKELDFTLKEIKEIMATPQFDQRAAFQKQRELIQLKRDRYDALLGLLDRLIKGERAMEFQEFDMSEYFRVLADFKRTHAEEIMERLGGVEAFDEIIAALKANESEIAAEAVKQYGSLERYTAATKENLERFLASGPSVSPADVSALTEEVEEVMRRLTADLNRDAASAEVQKIVSELVALVNRSNEGIDIGDHFWLMMVNRYRSDPIYLEVNDRKYGEGASQYISLALEAYLNRD